MRGARQVGAARWGARASALMGGPCIEPGRSRLPAPHHRRSMVKTGPGFEYGAVLAWAFVMSFFTLMCGLILEGFKDVVSQELEKSER